MAPGEIRIVRLVWPHPAPSHVVGIGQQCILLAEQIAGRGPVGDLRHDVVVDHPMIGAGEGRGLRQQTLFGDDVNAHRC